MGEGAEYKSELKKEKVLKALLEDPVLSDVPKNPSLEDVETLIGLELGSAMRISVLKLDSSSFDVIVMNTATVKVLKLAIKKKVNYMEQSSMGHRHISWKSVWANYCLSFDNNKLLNHDHVLQDLGVRNNSQVYSNYLFIVKYNELLVFGLNLYLFPSNIVNFDYKTMFRIITEVKIL